MKVHNRMRLVFDSRSANEGFARTAVAAFVAQLDPTVEEINDIRTAVSEAVTNCIVHAYQNEIQPIYITACLLQDNWVQIKIRDKGCGIADVKKAMEPLYTTCTTGERAGLGFALMESMSDRMKVRSTPGKGTTVTLEKRIRSRI